MDGPYETWFRQVKKNPAFKMFFDDIFRILLYTRENL